MIRATQLHVRYEYSELLLKASVSPAKTDLLVFDLWCPCMFFDSDTEAKRNSAVIGRGRKSWWVAVTYANSLLLELPRAASK